MIRIELALRGQEYPTQELLDYKYREKFHLSQQQLLEEPLEVYRLNLKIMSIENKIKSQGIKRMNRYKSRNIR